MRELREEIGLVVNECPRRVFKIEACSQTGQEFVWLYEGASEGPFTLHPEEIERGDWFSRERVTEWIRMNVPTEAVFAIDRWNPYLPSVFIPQQVVVYPQVEQTFENEEELFAPYYGLYSERIRESRVQPFFNSVETPAQRSAFIERLGVTHVLVDPAYYREMRQVLDQRPGQYALRFSEAEWAVYEVLPPRPGV